MIFSSQSWLTFTQGVDPPLVGQVIDLAIQLSARIPRNPGDEDLGGDNLTIISLIRDHLSTLRAASTSPDLITQNPSDLAIAVWSLGLASDRITPSRS